MNERIQELEKQAFDAVWDLDNDPIGPGTHFKPDGFEQKFAELIIGECADLFKNVLISVETEHGHQSVMASKFIRNHFGIEE